MKRIGILAGLLTASLALPALAQPRTVVLDPLGNFNLLLTVFDPSFCAGPFGHIDEGTCSDLTSPAGGIPGTAFVWVVVSREGGFVGSPPNGVGGVEFGIAYGPEVSVVAWFLCTGGMQIPMGDWPVSGEALAAVWPGGCYETPGEAAKVGFFLIQNGATGGFMRVVQSPYALGGPAARFGRCYPDGTDYDVCPSNLGQMVSLGNPGPPVCGDHCSVPVVGSSWGEIKALFD